MEEELKEYGYPEGEKSWLDLIIEYLKQKKEASKPKLEGTV